MTRTWQRVTYWLPWNMLTFARRLPLLQLRWHCFEKSDMDTVSGIGRNRSSITTFYADQLGKAGGDYYTTYFPQPTWLTSRNYFLHYTGSNYAVLDFRHPQFLEMFVEGDTGTAQWHLQVRGNIDLQSTVSRWWLSRCVLCRPRLCIWTDFVILCLFRLLWCLLNTPYV